MTLKDLRAQGLGLIGRVRKLPLSVTLIAATVALVLVLLAAFGLSGPRYAVLFDGLSPADGGRVIAALQKEGIPYQLGQNGDVISVPSADLGLARLRLGVDGQPQTGSGASWKALEGASVTTSEAATSALQLQATESSLQDSITALSGASQVQVLLALPKETPFLADQAKPKASVILTGAPQADGALGGAIAKIVSGAVPGLDAKNVVVATNEGAIIYPQGKAGGVAAQLAVVQRIEAAQEAKIRSLLVPILGPGNARVTVSADVDFSDKTITSVNYGPKSYPVTTSTQSKVEYGAETPARGIPGALSNQPPGPTTAPVTPTDAGTATQTPPRRDDKQAQSTFAVDKTSATEHPAPWSVRKINASVVVNSAALGKMTTAQLKTMIGSTIAVPVGQVDVTRTDFVTDGTALAASPGGQITRVIQGLLLIVAALGFLFGGARPLVGWLRQLGQRPQRVASRPEAAAQPFQESLNAVNLRNIAGQVTELGIERPEMMAAVLQRWLSGEGPEMKAEDAG